MLQDHRFGLFIEDDEGLVFREYCSNLENAKLRGQHLANMEGSPSFLYVIKGYKEVACFSPSGQNKAPATPPLPQRSHVTALIRT